MYHQIMALKYTSCFTHFIWFSVYPGVMSADQSAATIDVDGVHSNIVIIDLVKDGLTSETVVKRLSQVRNHTHENQFRKVSL